MFSMAVEFLPTTKLAQRMPLLQHLVAMAVVHGIKTIPGYEVGEIIISNGHFCYIKHNKVPPGKCYLLSWEYGFHIGMYDVIKSYEYH